MSISPAASRGNSPLPSTDDSKTDIVPNTSTQKNALMVFYRTVQSCVDLDDADARNTLKQLTENFSKNSTLSDTDESISTLLIPVINNYIHMQSPDLRDIILQYTIFRLAALDRKV